MEAQPQPHASETNATAARPKRALSAEVIAVLAVGATLGILILAGLSGVRADMREIRADMRDVRTDIRTMSVRLVEVERRQARVEGLLEGLRDTLVDHRPPAGTGEG